MPQQRERRKAAFSRGLRAETLAAFLLMLKGYRILAKRYRTRLGEIDIIARRGNLILIVEVKARTSLAAAMEAVSPLAMQRIENAADVWLARQPDHAQLSLRFDLIAVRPWRLPQHKRAFFQSGGRW